MSVLRADHTAFGAAAAEAPPLHSGRSRRVVLLLPVIWALNLVDLSFTLLAGTTRDFVELNPLAAGIGPGGQAALKMGMLMLCTCVFVALRRRRSAEMGCYLLLAVYGTLSLIWMTTFRFLLSPIYVSRLLGTF